MIRQFVVNEIQNQSVIPLVFSVADDSEAAKKAAEALAYSRFYQIMAAAVESAVIYHGANIIYMEGTNQLMIDGRMIDRSEG